MKIRLCVLGLAALLLTSTWAKAQALSPSADPAAPVAKAAAEAPDVAPFCPASAATPQSLDLNPRPLVKATVTCGSCSYSSCQGMAPNSACYYLDRFGYHLAKCVINFFCSEDNKPGCDCTNNPPV